MSVCPTERTSLGQGGSLAEVAARSAQLWEWWRKAQRLRPEWIEELAPVRVVAKEEWVDMFGWRYPDSFNPAGMVKPVSFCGVPIEVVPVIWFRDYAPTLEHFTEEIFHYIFVLGDAMVPFSVPS